IARIMGTFGPSLAGTRVEQVDTRLPDGRRVKGEWVYGPRADSPRERPRSSIGADPTRADSPRERPRSSIGADPTRADSPRERPRSSIGAGAIYYVHGSGYAVCSPKTHRRLTAWLSALTGLPVFSVDYRLGPRPRVPPPPPAVLGGRGWLVQSCGVSPKQIVIT